MAIATRPVNYDDQEAALTGVLVWDDAASRPLPGLLLVHGGAGLDDHARGRPGGTPSTATRSSPVTCSGRASPVTGSASWRA